MEHNYDLSENVWITLEILSHLFLLWYFFEANPISKGTRWALVIFYKLCIDGGVGNTT